MRRILTLLLALFISAAAFAQAEKSIIIEQNSFRPEQKDALTGVNIDPIGLDYSKRPCARLKVKINRMTKEEIDGIEVKVVTNNAVMKCKTAEYDNGLIIELTAKPQTRFYFHHDEFGDSNEVCLDLEADKVYRLDAHLNQSFSIVVNSNVVGADVYLDNIFKGQTSEAQSLTIQEVMIGDHDLRLEWGKSRYEQKITVNKGNISFRQNIDTKASEPQFVVFVVEPGSAVVTIDNQHYTLQDGAMQLVLDSGTYNYTVSAAGYHSQSGTFSVSGSKVTRNITLTKDAATVNLTAPEGGEIWVNGVKKGEGSWSGTLVAGTYIFETRKAGHKSSTLSKQITSEQAQQSYTLPAPTPIYGTLIVSGTPIMADVAVDGKTVGQIPIKLSNLLVGEHTVTISKVGYATHTQRVNIAEEKSCEVKAALIKGKVYKIGDYYNDGKKEGVVFETWDSGRCGKIVSMDVGTKLGWSVSGEDDKLIGALYNTDGACNMEKVKAIEGWQSKYPAFKWCADHGEGWYLPARDELKQLLQYDSTLKAVNATLKAQEGKELFTGSLYASSTETGYSESKGSEYFVWTVGAREDSYWLKWASWGYGVRAVSTFGDTPKGRELPPKKTITSAPYQVGNYYNDGVKEGVVFEVTKDGKHGKIISMFRLITSWYEPYFQVKKSYGKIGASNETDGSKNMDKYQQIRKKDSSAADDFQSFLQCSNLGEGWYVPAIEELKAFTYNIRVRDIIHATLQSLGADPMYDLSVGTFKGVFYSSTENDKTTVWSVKMEKTKSTVVVHQKGGDKVYGYVRPIAKF